MAPNKRADNKRKLNLWLDVDLYNRFSRAAEAFGLSMTSILTAFIIEKVDEYEATIKRRDSSVPDGESADPSRES